MACVVFWIVATVLIRWRNCVRRDMKNPYVVLKIPGIFMVLLLSTVKVCAGFCNNMVGV